MTITDREAERVAAASGSACRARPRSPDRARPTARRGRSAAGSSAIARAMAARFFMPPEISDGQLCPRSLRARRARASRARSRRCASVGRSVHCSSGSATFSPTVIEPKSAPDWNITPNGGRPTSSVGRADALDADRAGHAASRGRSGSAAASTCRSRCRRGSRTRRRARTSKRQRSRAARVAPAHRQVFHVDERRVAHMPVQRGRRR